MEERHDMEMTNLWWRDTTVMSVGVGCRLNNVLTVNVKYCRQWLRRRLC